MHWAHTVLYWRSGDGRFAAAAMVYKLVVPGPHTSAFPPTPLTTTSLDDLPRQHGPQPTVRRSQRCDDEEG